MIYILFVQLLAVNKSLIGMHPFVYLQFRTIEQFLMNGMNEFD